MKTKKPVTQRQVEDKWIEKTIKDIRKLERKHGKTYVRAACRRYANREAERIRLEKQIAKAEQNLTDLKLKKN